MQLQQNELFSRVNYRAYYFCEVSWLLLQCTSIIYGLQSRCGDLQRDRDRETEWEGERERKRVRYIVLSADLLITQCFFYEVQCKMSNSGDGIVTVMTRVKCQDVYSSKMYFHCLCNVTLTCLARITYLPLVVAQTLFTIFWKVQPKFIFTCLEISTLNFFLSMPQKCWRLHAKSSANFISVLFPVLVSIRKSVSCSTCSFDACRWT